MRSSQLRFALAALALLTSCDSDPGSTSGTSSDSSHLCAEGAPCQLSVDSTQDSARPWNKSIAYGILIDARDHQSYRTVTIGSQTWMAENLDYDSSSTRKKSGYPRGNKYAWTTAMQIDPAYRNGYWPGSGRVQGICPAGWHVPSADEWDILGGPIFDEGNHMGMLLKSTTGWRDGGNGSDTYGFRVLPDIDSCIESDSIVTSCTTFWTASQSESGYSALKTLAYVRAFASNSTTIQSLYGFKSDSLPLRCLKD